MTQRTAQASLAAVIRFRDSEKTLPSVLAALDAQTRRPDVIVGIDNGSRDGSRQMLIDHGATVIDWTEPYHVSRVLNAGIAACASDLVLIVSSHTVLEDPGTVARYVATMADADVACVSARPPGYARLPESIDWETVARNGLTYCSIYSNSHGMIRRAFWAELPFDDRLGVAAEDYCWALEQLKRGRRVAMLPVSYRYLKRGRAPHAATLRAVLAVGRHFGLPMGWLGVKRTALAAALALVRVVGTAGRSAAQRDDLAKHLGHLRGWWRWRRHDPFRARR